MSSVLIKRQYLGRQIAHWRLAAARLKVLDDMAGMVAWQSLEEYLGVAIRRCLLDAVSRLEEMGGSLWNAYSAARTGADLEVVRRRLLDFRAQYLRVETTLDFYVDAINTRTSPDVAARLRACDALASRSMSMALDPLGIQTPLVLSYMEPGLGAAIMKANLRLWDRSTLSPAAAIRVVKHNMGAAPTALIHETGHQVAHLVGWTDELAAALSSQLGPSKALADIWAGWASEIAADAFAFVHTGYASVAGLHDVVAGGERSVFGFRPGDPHPVSYLRVLLGIQMCRTSYGSGPWDDLEESWIEMHPLTRLRPDLRELLERSIPLLPAVAELCYRTPMRAFQGRSLAALINPDRVRPDVLLAMEAQLGPALYTSLHWIWTEALRLLALHGYLAATSVGDPMAAVTRQDNWMLKLGGALRAA